MLKETLPLQKELNCISTLSITSWNRSTEPTTLPHARSGQPQAQLAATKRIGDTHQIRCFQSLTPTGTPLLLQSRPPIWTDRAAVPVTLPHTDSRCVACAAKERLLQNYASLASNSLAKSRKLAHRKICLPNPTFVSNQDRSPPSNRPNACISFLKFLAFLKVRTIGCL